MRIKNLSDNMINQGLLKGNQAVERIYKHLNITATITLDELYNRVLDDLEGKFDIIYYNDSVFDSSQQSIVALVKFDDGNDKKAKGEIILNQHYPEEAQIEAVFHEYIHIMEDSLPVYSLASNISTDSMFESETMNNADIMADLITYTLMMRPKDIKSLLIRYKYDINKILNEYNCLEQCTVIQWIVINSLIPCHFSWSMLPNGDKNNIIHYDSCRYYRGANPQNFDIEIILNIPYSAVAESLEWSRNIKKPTFIGGVEYQCYAYYKTNLRTDISNFKSRITTVSYDRLVVIGWKKEDFSRMKIMISDIEEISKD